MRLITRSILRVYVALVVIGWLNSQFTARLWLWIVRRGHGDSLLITLMGLGDLSPLSTPARFSTGYENSNAQGTQVQNMDAELRAWIDG